jgi:electron transport complex protein RnfB
MESISGDFTGWQAWSAKQANHARDRYAAHRSRLAEQATPTDVAADAHAEANNITSEKSATPNAIDAESRKKSMVQAALARAQALKSKATGRAN